MVTWKPFKSNGWKLGAEEQRIAEWHLSWPYIAPCIKIASMPYFSETLSTDYCIILLVSYNSACCIFGSMSAHKNTSTKNVNA